MTENFLSVADRYLRKTLTKRTFLELWDGCKNLDNSCFGSTLTF